jgi:hypothetical protein
MRQIVLDTETTGFYANHPDNPDRMVEIGCVELVNRKLTGNNLHFYLNPGRDSDEGALRASLRQARRRTPVEGNHLLRLQCHEAHVVGALHAGLGQRIDVNGERAADARLEGRLERVVAGILPEACSRHNTPSRAWATPHLVPAARGAARLGILVALDDAEHALAHAIGIARALALNPRLIVADEATSALDVSLRSQMLDLLLNLQDKLGLSFIFISHDIAVIRYFCDRVAVMYRGKVVETGETNQVCDAPTHAYTQALLSAIPQPDPRARSMHKRFRYNPQA